MTRDQEKILELLKEIDQVCQKNDIPYYAIAGTALGAVRHRGFIPWDEDIDIYMTRDNWEKFRAIMEKEMGPDRALEYVQKNPEYPLTFPRYVDTTNASIFRVNVLDIYAAGQFIDIILLDPIPDGEKEREKFLRLFVVYSEIVSMYYLDNRICDVKLYWYYRFLCHILGRKRVMRMLERKLFRYKEEDCEAYSSRYAGFGHLHVYEKSIFGTPKYLPFEDTVCAMPEHVEDVYLRRAYGDSWMMIPDAKNQAIHQTVNNFDVSYKYLLRDVTQFVDKKKARKMYFETKRRTMAQLGRREYAVTNTHKLNAMLVKNKLENRLKKENIDLEALVQEERFGELKRLFSEYYQTQFSQPFSHWGIFVDLDDDTLYAALIPLVLQDGQYYRAAKVLGYRIAAKGELNGKLLELNDLIDQTRELSVAWENKRPDEVRQVIESCLEQYPHHIDYLRSNLRLKSIDAKTREEFLQGKQYALEILDRFPKDGESMKYLADICIALEDWEEAFQWYNLAKIHTNNGLLLLEIGDMLSKYFKNRKQEEQEELESGKHKDTGVPPEGADFSVESDGEVLEEEDSTQEIDPDPDPDPELEMQNETKEETEASPVNEGEEDD